MTEKVRFLSGLRIGEPQTHANMRIYALHQQNGHERAYLTLEEALRDESLQIGEISEGGAVPRLTAHNSSPKPVLLVVGEQLIGAKQNRILNTSILVPAQGQIEIPVTCVEQGRWHYTSRLFSSSDTTSHMTLRRSQVEQVTEQLRSTQTFESNQRVVWQEVQRKMKAHDTGSVTSALSDVFEHTRHQLKDYLDAFQTPTSEGILVTINGAVAGADIFDHHETLQQLFPKLLRGYALDALERHQAEEAAAADVEGFLAELNRAEVELYQSVGLGQDARLTSSQLSGSSLLWQEKGIHTSIFSRA